MLDRQTAQSQQRGNPPEEVRTPMGTGYCDQLIPMTAPQQGNLPNAPPASIPPTHYEPGVGQAAPPMSPQGGGGTELPIDPEQLRELRLRHFQTQMDNAHT
eukprot:8991954-Pyramimonas_sp.AAC.1